MTEWLPITYRDFYDVPRMFIVELDTAVVLFDSEFDESADDYRDTYTVYRLGSAPGDGDWRLLPSSGTQIAKVPVSAVKFDSSLRKYIHASVMDQFEIR